ncbi:hypothetical protein ccbrp13_22040 [Ktedonobacteria bacterium brp13]|nr:hypothetical protein ccbrp13_22040 [Ktedonobacteria bacterium brp13]
MKKRMILGAIALAAMLATLFTSSVTHAATNAAASVRHTALKTHQVHLLVNEHRTATKYFVVSQTPGDPTGNYLVFADDVYNQADTKLIGKSDGICTYVSSTNVECQWDLVFKRGATISVQGQAVHGATIQTFSVVGGTGKYNQALGALHSRTLQVNNATEYQYTIYATVVSTAKVTPS